MTVLSHLFAYLNWLLQTMLSCFQASTVSHFRLVRVQVVAAANNASTNNSWHASPPVWRIQNAPWPATGHRNPLSLFDQQDFTGTTPNILHTLSPHLNPHLSLPLPPFHQTLNFFHHFTSKLSPHFNMVQSRSEVMRQLAALSTTEILSLLTDETILEVAAKYFETHATNIDVNLPLSPTEADAIVTPPSPAMSDDTPPPRAKRPLNAFMAFRSMSLFPSDNTSRLPLPAFYMKLFPDIQQKSASGFLTTLWNKDPFRNKWALIAKVYSFVRDEVGKRNIALSRFLDVCCPTMNIIHPSGYIAALGWSVTYDDAGSHVLHQNQPTNLDHFQNEVVPSTEMDLLRALLQTGYLSDRGLALLERLSESTNGIMTTYGSSMEAPVIQTPEKLDLVETIRADPVQAAKELFRAREDEYLDPTSVATYEVYDLSNAPYAVMQAPQPDPLQYYNFAGASMGLRPSRTFHLRSVQEFDSIDIDSPYDVDAMMDYTQSEGERSECNHDMSGTATNMS